MEANQTIYRNGLLRLYELTQFLSRSKTCETRDTAHINPNLIFSPSYFFSQLSSEGL